jgi:hypothetical protein
MFLKDLSFNYMNFPKLNTSCNQGKEDNSSDAYSLFAT